MNNTNNMKTLCERITNLRKEKGLTQEQFASKLGLTFQAVSKWENEVSCPDIILLPEIADIFNVTIDELFGRASTAQNNIPGINWEDDGKLRAVVFIGRKYIHDYQEANKYVFEYRGPALDVISNFNVNCGDVEGNLTAGGHVNCGDVEGNVNAGGSTNSGDIEGDVSAGGNVNAGDIEGGVKAEGSVNAGEIEGDVTTSGNVKAKEINGAVSASTVECDRINGEIHSR